MCKRGISIAVAAALLALGASQQVMAQAWPSTTIRLISKLPYDPVRERLAKRGAEPFSLSPEQFDSYIREELAQNAKIIKAAVIKAE